MIVEFLDLGQRICSRIQQGGQSFLPFSWKSTFKTWFAYWPRSPPWVSLSGELSPLWVLCWQLRRALPASPCPVGLGHGNGGEEARHGGCQSTAHPFLIGHAEQGTSLRAPGEPQGAHRLGDARKCHPKPIGPFSPSQLDGASACFVPAGVSRTCPLGGRGSFVPIVRAPAGHRRCC